MILPEEHYERPNANAGLLERVVRKLTEKPAGMRLREIFYFFVYPALAQVVRRQHFRLGEEEFEYGRQRKNLMLATERAVEVPIALACLKRHSGSRVLEIGNVLGQYADSSSWDVVDKYEPGPGVINEDILDFQSAERYDFIFSISTLEHVGYNEAVRDPDKISRAMTHIIENLLAPGGELLVTLPLGWNPHLDDLYRSGNLPFQETRLMRRTGWANAWIEAEPADSKAMYKYGRYIGADWLLICRLTKP